MAKKKKTPAKKNDKKAVKKAAPAKVKAKAAKPAAKKAAPKKVVAKKAKPAPKASLKKTVGKKIAAVKNAILGSKKKAPVPPAPKKVEAKTESKKEKAKVSLPLAKPVEEKAEEVVLTDAQGRRYCRVKDCDQLATVDVYCRYHYLLFWKKIQIRKKILSEGKLERYIEELTARYPDKYLDMLRKDLRSEKEFLAAIQELEIDDSSEEGEFEDDSQSFIEEVRGISTETAGGRTDDEY